MQDYLFVDLQGFKTSMNEFIVKEFAYSTLEYTQTFLIKPPFTFSKLLESEKVQTRWLENHLGIMWHEGYVDYREFKRLIVNHIKDKTIFVKGVEKIEWVKHLCSDCTIIDLGEKGSPNLKELIKKYCLPECTFNCVNHKKNCALKNVLCIKKWYLNN
jgi:hypothetical protein